MIYDTNHYGDDEGTAQRAAQRASIPDLGKKIVAAVRERSQKRYRVIDREELASLGRDVSQILYGYALADYAPTYITAQTPDIVAFGNDFDLIQELADRFNKKVERSVAFRD